MFSALEVSNNPPVSAGLAPGLVWIAQMETLEASEPWVSVFPQITPISSRRVGWLDQCATLYQEYEDQNRQCLWESTHAIFISR